VNRTSAYRRARRAFWVCVVVAVALTGGLSVALHSAPGPATALAVAGLGVLFTGVVALAVRLLLALTGRLPATGGNRATAPGDRPPRPR